MKRKNDKYLKIIDQIEKIRSKNNLNWMDILRLAFKHSPEEAKKFVRKINKSDSKITSLLDKLTK